MGQIVELVYSRISNKLSVTSSKMVKKMALLFAKTEFKNRGCARGGLGAIAPPSECASPPSEGEKRFFSESFGIYSTLKTIF